MQNKANKICKGSQTYFIYNTEKKDILAELQYEEYNLVNFQWILVYNLYTKKEYRNNGFATMLLNKVYDFAESKNKGLYLFVDINNNAIKLYKKNGFIKLKEFSFNGDKKYFLMYKGNKNIAQLERNFY